jgi:hypothetical protein
LGAFNIAKQPRDCSKTLAVLHWTEFSELVGKGYCLRDFSAEEIRSPFHPAGERGSLIFCIGLPGFEYVYLSCELKGSAHKHSASLHLLPTPHIWGNGIIKITEI